MAFSLASQDGRASVSLTQLVDMERSWSRTLLDHQQGRMVPA